MNNFTFHLSQCSYWLLKAKRALEEYRLEPNNVHKRINVMHLIDIAEGDYQLAEKTFVTEGSS